MRYGIIVPHVNIGGSTARGYYNSQEIGMARAMRDLGYDVFYFAVDGAGKECLEETVEERICVVHLPIFHLGAHGFFNVHILDKYQLDCVQLCSDNQIFAPTIARHLDKKGVLLFNYIGTIESNKENIVKRRVMSFLFRRNLRMIDAHKCFAKTECVRECLLRKGVKAAEVLPVGLDTTQIEKYTGTTREEVRRQLEIPTDKRIVLFVGKMSAYKRPLEALDLFKQLDDAFFFVMIGSGEMDDKIEEMVNSERGDPIRDRLLWIKRIPNKEIHRYYYVADYSINMNRGEIFGMSILEAMYQGCPVVACHAPGPDSIISDGETGFLVDNIDEMASVIRSGVSLDGTVLRETVERSYSWHTRAARIDEWVRNERREY